MFFSFLFFKIKATRSVQCTESVLVLNKQVLVDIQNASIYSSFPFSFFKKGVARNRFLCLFFSFLFFSFLFFSFLFFSFLFFSFLFFSFLFFSFLFFFFSFLFFSFLFFSFLFFSFLFCKLTTLQRKVGRRLSSGCEPPSFSYGTGQSLGFLLHLLLLAAGYLCFHPDGWHRTWVSRRCLH